MATLYGELINTSISTTEDAKREFKKTKTYQNYYINLVNPQLIFNKELCLDKNDLPKINEIIEKTIDEFNQINVNNKIKKLSDLKFYYNNENVDDFVNKVTKLAKKEEEIVKKKLPHVFKKILSDKQKKIKTLNEADFNFNDNKIFPGRL
jgi:glutamyl-tRNA reductase